MGKEGEEEEGAEGRKEAEGRQARRLCLFFSVSWHK